LHPPLNSFSQYFPKAPKLLSTLQMGEVSVRPRTSQECVNGEVGVDGNFREMM